MTKIEEPRLVSIEDIKRSVNSMTFSDSLFISSDFESTRIMAGFPVKIDGVIISVCKRGSIDIAVGMKRYTVKRNDMAFILPGNIIKVFDKTDDVDMVSLIFSRENLLNIHIDVQAMLPTMLNIRENPVKNLSQEEGDLIMEYYELIKGRVSAFSGRHKNETIHHLLMALFLEISNFYSMPMDIHKSKSRKDIIFEQFNNLIFQHHRDSRSVSFYAEKLYITPKHLSFVVKEVSGKTAAEWIDTHVILESMSLLKFSDMTVKQISNFLNFPNQSFFSKFFKRHTGMSPSDYKLK
ncbi:MAG: helix-turn-helix domain-containing protein [Rikenellaceae bacterium]|nr:helix-turn-helix domain-containing protein [Rikenellaceae bacterium]